MDREQPVSNWRAMALAVALLAITVNFLQPLAHAALMRSGMPSTLWSVFCSSAVADPDGKAATSTPAQAPADHECCLGLAHAPALVAPTTFALLPPVVRATTPVPDRASASAAGIRDGPHQPRGPPLLLV